MRDELAATIDLCAHAAGPAPGELWEAALELLLVTARFDEARTGLRLLTAAGLVDARAWLAFARRVYRLGDAETAWLAMEEAVTRLPPDARVWSIAALLRLEFGLVAEADDAAARALALDPRAAAAHLAAAVVAAARGDAPEARDRCEAARRLGAPTALVASYARRAGVG
jgi:tetratricopeptide (TPR) repeat protein